MSEMHPKARQEVLAFIFILSCSVFLFNFFKTWDQTQAAANDVILFWEGSTSTIPAGWTCVSCNPGDQAGATNAFKDAFPKASSTYGSATTSANTVTHTVTFSASTTGAGVGLNSSTGGTATPRDTHTHSWGNPTISAENIQPPFQQLIMIKAANPDRIPAGAIAMFGGTSGTLPVGWTYYSAMENNYLHAGNASSTGGSLTGAPTSTAALTSGNSSGAFVDAGNGNSLPTATHNHAIVAASALNSDNHNPPYIGVVFAKIAAAGPIPNNLLAFFDATTPTGWVATSTNGSNWDNRLVIGSSTFGNTGGATTHNHGGSVTWTSGGQSATLNNKTGSSAQAANLGHTHDVTYTASTASSMPINRGVIVGQKLAPHLTQAQYRWYQNVNSDTPTTALATTNSSTTVSNGTIYRLRTNIKVATSSLSALNDFKLQFATSTGGPWQDVGLQASSSIWIGADNNNATTTDGITIASTLLSSSTVAETYEEENAAASTPNQIAVNGFGEWDWVLKANSLAASTNYFFRLVRNDGSDTPLDTYENYAAVTRDEDTTSCSTNTTSTDFGALVASVIATSAPNASTTMSCSGGLGCSLYISDAGDGANPGLATTTPAYLIPSGTSTLATYTEGYGVQATTTATGSGGTLGIPATYNRIGDDVGGLALTNMTIASSTIAITDREVVVTHKASVSGATTPGSYVDTITYSCVGN